MIYSSKAVANWFIETASKENQTINLIKLIKLVYIAQGISLVIDNPLLDEKIQAWPYGPVIQSVYYNFKKHYLDPITELAIETQEEPIDKNKLEFQAFRFIPRVYKQDNAAQEILNATWKIFGTWTDVELANWSSQAGSPWDIEWNREKTNRSHAMSNQRVTDYFKKIIGF